MADKEEAEPTAEAVPAELPDASDTSRDPKPQPNGPNGANAAKDDRSPNSQGEKVLEPAGVAAAATGAKAKSERAGRPARTQKGAPTTKRDQPVKRERTSPIKFVRQSIAELRKVVYPTGPQLINYFFVVLVFVLFVIAYVSLLDLGIGWAIFRIFS
ncbi:MAG TPA: preprotein translocase subunit SecE [Propionibacteriaceae bacterium]|nr:preprotein translocase subunit SecE [Propionibacteriaceae bacterium]